MLTIIIHVQNLFLSTATKQWHLNLISKLIPRIALLLTKHNTERCHVKILILYPCRLSSPLSSSSKTLSKHILSTPMFRFYFHSIRGTVGIRETGCRAILELPNRVHLYSIFGLTGILFYKYYSYIIKWLLNFYWWILEQTRVLL
jgi:hypothetical protein